MRLVSTSVTLFRGKEFSLQLLTTACCSISRGSDPSDLHRHLHPCVHPHTQPNTEPQVQTLRKRIFKNLKKRDCFMLYLYSHLKEPMSVLHGGTSTFMFTAVLVTRAKTCTQTSCPSTQEQIETMWCLYIMECYSDIRRTKR